MWLLTAIIKLDQQCTQNHVSLSCATYLLYAFSLFPVENARSYTMTLVYILPCSLLPCQDI